MTDREQIVAYFRHLASVEVGSVLSAPAREMVDMCASWVENRVDEVWARRATMRAVPGEKP